MSTKPELIVGVTGGIGSGKTAATNAFAELGITVVDADRVSRDVVMPGTPALNAIAAHFGADNVINLDDSLNRRALRDIIFASHDHKKWLEQLLHPLIRQEIILQLRQSRSPYTILSSPLLLETDQQTLCHRVLLIDAPESLQILRTVERDNTTEAGVKAIMDSQLSRQQRQARADDIIVNDKDLTALKQLVEQQHQTYLGLIA